MNRFRQLPLRLYPAEWRARYGEELAALVEDVPPSWRSNFDLLKGALKMQFSMPAFPKLAVMLSMAGLLTGFLVSFAVPARYTSSGLLEYQDRGAEDKNGSGRRSSTDRFMTARSVILSQAVLSSVMMDPRVDIYRPDRERMPLEDVIAAMRRDIDIGIASAGDRVSTIRVAFTYSDPRKTQTVANVLISKLIEENIVEQTRRTIPPTTQEQQLMEAVAQLQSRVASLERRAGVVEGRAPDSHVAVSPTGEWPQEFALYVIDPPSLPTHPVWPDRNRFMAVGFGGGIFLALVIVAFRPGRSAAPPMRASLT